MPLKEQNGVFLGLWEKSRMYLPIDMKILLSIFCAEK